MNRRDFFRGAAGVIGISLLKPESLPMRSPKLNLDQSNTQESFFPIKAMSDNGNWVDGIMVWEETGRIYGVDGYYIPLYSSGK